MTSITTIPMTDESIVSSRLQNDLNEYYDKIVETSLPCNSGQRLNNPMAVLKTIGSLLALDKNPQHQKNNNKYNEQQIQFELKLKQYESLHNCKETENEKKPPYNHAKELETRKELNNYYNVANCFKDQQYEMSGIDRVLYCRSQEEDNCNNLGEIDEVDNVKIANCYESQTPLSNHLPLPVISADSSHYIDEKFMKSIKNQYRLYEFSIEDKELGVDYVKSDEKRTEIQYEKEERTSSTETNKMAVVEIPLIKQHNNFIYSIYKGGESTLKADNNKDNLIKENNCQTNSVSNISRNDDAKSKQFKTFSVIDCSACNTFTLRHDSYTLTAILSSVFIVTFIFLLYFPLPG